MTGFGCTKPPYSLKKRKGPTSINIIIDEMSHPKMHLSSCVVLDPRVFTV